MINLKEVSTSKKEYKNSLHQLLIMGMHEDKQLSPQQKLLDSLITNKLSMAIELEKIIGKKDKQRE